MAYAEVLLLCSLVIAQYVAIISGQTCRTTNPQNRAWIPATWKTIVDSSDYETLLTSFWVALDVDSDGETFESAGGVCTRNLYSCPDTTFTLDGNENNWAFTHHISYGDAREVFFNISTSFTSCRFIMNCQNYLTLYRYDTNSASETARTTTTNYQLLTGTQSSSRFGSTSPQTESILRPSGINQFYLGFRDTGTCVNVERVIAYYRVCPARVSGLVRFPETAVPPTSSPNEAFSGSCAPNSHAATSLMVDITSSTSVCTERAPGGARCECNAGYSSNTTACLACPAGEYRALSQSQDRCNTCPSNTDTSVVSASMCACRTRYFRSPQEGPEVGCTQPPTAVQNLRTVSTTANTVTVSWMRPASTGRSDYYYFVGRSDPQGSATSVVSVNDRLIDQGSTVMAVISGLLPSQSYVITVIAHNGVSSLDSVNVGSRTQTVEAQTMASPPGPPLVTPLCTVVVWQPPTNPNGVISGYQIRYAGGTASRLSSTVTFSTTTELQRSSNVQVEVAAINSAGRGSWSSAVQICQDACSLPFNVRSTSSSLVLTWQRPASVSGNTYNIQVSESGRNTRSFTHTNSGNSLTYTIMSLTPFTSYVITLMNGQRQCRTTALTSDGVPSIVTSFQQFCNVITWRPPTVVQGNLARYELQFRLSDGTLQQPIQLGADVLFYITRSNQRTRGVQARIRAVNGANSGNWTNFFSNGCEFDPESCSLTIGTITVSSVALSWSKPSSSSGSLYNLYLDDGTTVTTSMVTDTSSTVQHTINNLKPFTKYTVNVTLGRSSCAMSFTTLQGAPSTPMNFKQYCNVVTWNTPSDLQGELKGYEVSIKIGDQLETEFLGPEMSSYPTTEKQREMNAQIQVRANNTKNTGAWTSFYSIGCSEAGAKENTGVLSSTGAVDVVIIVVVTAAVCIAIFILIVILVYFFYKCRSKGSYSGKNGTNNNFSTSSDVKLNNLY